ncbi:MAG: hypothetical protein INR66_27280 [Gordonia polyisoprenivorans]|nr:hypothetical protein [Gordonia polyisoprenivorans]
MLDMPTMPWDPIDRALYRLQVIFPSVPDRIVGAIFRSYLDSEQTLSHAVSASRNRIIDACYAS